MLRRMLNAAMAVLLVAPVIHAQNPPVPAPAAAPAPAPAAKKWDVTEALGPTSKLQLETSEGTWMNVDVSPDGRTIVFDLLGNIYTMPLAGGRATRITSGPAFDIQPRFSPDGSRIAIISDRDGGFNIWTVKPDGSGAKQISKEQQRLVNSPTWAPDGQYIYARKHFVRERSLGAGEVWMYHASGTEGLQVTERNGWQKDAGEPALSPDGKYLYYSKDLTPGQTFEYDKDPYDGIYGILRRDLTTGRERMVTRKGGGAITPRISPDGKSLAFIRRVGLKSVLHLHDLATGREWPVFDRLDRDMQEAWSIHGVYPQYAWTPDGQSIVIWGEGKIWKVDVANRRGVEIPFTAQIDQTINEAVRYNPDIAANEFQVKMLRDVETSHDGRFVTYSALGHIYIKQLPNGEPRRLTGDTQLEYDPAFSPDGQWIVYTTWSDSLRGRVRVIRVNGSNARDVVRIPGHYTEPSFSPDGRTIVYRATGGDNVRGSENSVETGIFIVPADGSREPTRVTDSGSDPQFDHTGERIYLRAFRNEKFVLLSVDRDGSDEVVHFQSDNATQYAPSPDGKWIAFAERYRAYVAAFPRSGRTVDLGPRTNTLPVARISRDAGMYLHWSGDSRKVHWALGPELYTRDLGRTFTFLNQNLEKADDPEVKGVPIGFSVKADVPTSTIAFTGARIITMTRDSVIENGTVVVQNNRIVAVGPSASVTIPAGARRVDVAGKTIMPGIIDVHAHYGSESEGILAEQNWRFLVNLAFGVTTAHDPSNDTESVFTNAEMVRAGMKVGPRLFSTGTILYGAETPFKAVVESYDDALSHLRRMKAVGAFSVKSYNQLRRDARQMIIKAARETNMMVVPEGGSLLYYNVTHVLDGHTTVEHSLPVPRLYQDVVQLFAQSKTGYVPTLLVAYGGLGGENYWYQHYNVWEHPLLMQYTPADVVEPRSRRRLMAAEDDFNHVRVARGTAQIENAGGTTALGAHGQLQGLGAHWEMWSAQQGGLTNMQALRFATINGARLLGLDKELGTLEAGKLADLIVLDKNPLENIRNSDSVSWVMVNGRLYDPKGLATLKP
ncbi:MAG TPA: amidohydrolase family protein [Longimicrobiales bacterium]